jgi:6-phosphogluconolactonase (cycloisomerase 2 family)
MSGSPFATGSDPSSVVLDPAGNFLFVTNTAANTISAYSVNKSTGALTAVSGSPFASGGTGPVSANIDPSGSFLVTATTR